MLGLLPFALYKITVGYGLKRVAARAEPLPKSRMLFLRVFGSSSRSEKLLDLLAARWRYAGSIQLISATDVARGRFEPDEFLDFLNGRLASAYISDGADLDRRLAGLDLRPDPDGRYRVNEFFCHSDTWKQTVTRLMAQSDLVLMDLRAFASERKGCTFELGALIDEVPLHRVALLIDQTTDEPLLRRTLADRWRMMNPQSPNAHGGIARVRMIDLACGHPAAVRRLMQLGGEVSAVNATMIENPAGKGGVIRNARSVAWVRAQADSHARAFSRSCSGKNSTGALRRSAAANIRARLRHRSCPTIAIRSMASPCCI